MRRWLLLTMLSLLVWSGCDLLGSDEEDADRLVTVGVVVGNGGNFSDQNGSLTFYNPVTGQTSTLALNAFVQSLTLHKGRVYVALNTFSVGQVAVVDVAAQQLAGRIEGLPIPRYVAFASDQKAYVTNMVFGGNGLVFAVDPSNRTIVADSIEVGPFPEGIVVHEGRVYVANYGSLGAGRTISVLDAATDRVIGTLEPGCDGPKAVFVDDEDELVVVCQGKTVYNEDYSAVIERTNGQVVFMNPQTGAVVARLTFEVQLGSVNGTQVAYYAPTAEELYVISGSNRQIFRIDTDANALAATFTLPEVSDLAGLSAIAYDAAQRRIYVARLAAGPNGAPDYTAAGAVIILDRDGRQLGRFTVGPAPSHIELVQETR
ncbi:hypothetical protein [Rhodothermus profundi]|uniref:40-residue YVTN family beta-propeller repeat-containing protein n=1 Tax=Rhodothermus profundi TaxID=633813 RepID=A0A1M6RHZ4_9BACT|nr:hypothetical protein [Rhodothermus profundi]SHK32062.1 hypothetical protein SAMN04488087_0855 [Rhodothermus profundi]